MLHIYVCMYIYIYIHNILVIEFNRLPFSICGRWFRILLIVQLMSLCFDNIRDMCWIPIANVFFNQIFRLKTEFLLIWNYDIFLDRICYSSEFSYIFKYHSYLSYFYFFLFHHSIGSHRRYISYQCIWNQLQTAFLYIVRLIWIPGWGLLSKFHVKSHVS